VQTLKSRVIRSSRFAALKKVRGEILVSSVAMTLVAALYSNGPKWGTVSPLEEKPKLFVDEGSAARESEERISEFMQRVALAHVGKPQFSAPVEKQESLVEKAELKAPAVAPRSHRLSNASKLERPRGDNTSAASTAPKPLSEQAPIVAGEAAGAAGPAQSKESQPTNYGTRLIASFTNTVLAQNQRVIDGVTSMANAVTSLVKK